MRFGIAIIPHWPERDMLEFIQLADSLGFNNAWVCDQTFFIDPFPFLAVAGRITKQIQLGVGVTNPYTRTPSQVARSVGVLGNLTEKPVLLGIGAGNRRELLLPLGIEQTSPTTRIREMIDVTRSLLRGESVTYQSDSLTLKDVSLKFKPQQPAHMYIAARGPGTLRLSGEMADGVIIGDLVSDEGLAYAWSEIQKGLDMAGRDRSQLEAVSWTTCFLSDKNEAEVMRRLKPWIAHNLAASPPVVQAALGMDAERVEVMRSAYSQGGAEQAANFVSPEDIHKLSIVGSPQECATTIRRLQDRGIGQLTILQYSKDLNENRQLITRLAEEVFPLV